MDIMTDKIKDLLHHVYLLKAISLSDTLNYKEDGQNNEYFVDYVLEKLFSEYKFIEISRYVNAKKSYYYLTITKEGIKFLITHGYIDSLSQINYANQKIKGNFVKHLVATNRITLRLMDMYKANGYDVKIGIEVSLNVFSKFRPDSMIEVSKDGNNRYIFVELDRNTESNNVLTEKFISYDEFIRSNNIINDKVDILFVLDNLKPHLLENKKIGIAKLLLETQNSLKSNFNYFIGGFEAFSNADNFNIYNNSWTWKAYSSRIEYNQSKKYLGKKINRNILAFDTIYFFKNIAAEKVYFENIGIKKDFVINSDSPETIEFLNNSLDLNIPANSFKIMQK